MCGYVRKYHGRGHPALSNPGAVCRMIHSKEQCYMRRDDKWLEDHPDKSAADIPSWKMQDMSKNREKKASSAHTAETEEEADYYDGEEVAEDEFAQNIMTADDNSVSDTSFLMYTGSVSTTQQRKQNQVILTLDSGATTTCLKQGKLRPLPQPIIIHAAGKNMSTKATQSAQIPFPSLPGGVLQGIYTPHFRHNLVSTRALQKAGLRIVFPASKTEAQCLDNTGKNVCSFKLAPTGLYEATMPLDESANSVSLSDTLQNRLLHSRLGHIGPQAIQMLFKREALDGMPTPSLKALQECSKTCTSCIQGKTQALPHPLTNNRATKVLEIIHMDLKGPLHTRTTKGHRYWLTLVDDYSRYSWVIPLQEKSQVPSRLQEWTQQVENLFDHTVKQYHSDNGSEFLNQRLKTFTLMKGIKHTTSTPYSPEQNGVAEARNKVLGRFLRTLMIHSGAPHSLWHYGVEHSNLLTNISPHRLLQGQTPYQILHHEKFPYRRLRVWGCLTHVLLNPTQRHSKLDPVTKPAVFMGINQSGPGWIFLDPTTQKELKSSDAVFQEWVPFYARLQDKEGKKPESWTYFPNLEGDQPLEMPPAALPAPEPGNIEAELPAPAEQREPAEPHEVIPQANQEHVQEPRRSRRLAGDEPEYRPIVHHPRYGIPFEATPDFRRAPEHNPDLLPEGARAMVAEITAGESGNKAKEIPVPQNWEEALAGAHSSDWMEAMVKEFKGLETTGTFVQVPREKAVNIIKCKWVYRVKTSPAGAPVFKARLVAKGFSQKHGINVFDTWAPTARLATLIALLHEAASRDMELETMDVDQAFLHGELPEIIFMEAAPGLENASPNMVWQLKRPLYGLKQAPRQWYAKLKEILVKEGYYPTSSDPCLFRHKKHHWILVHVDDLLLATQGKEEMTRIKAQLRSYFPMKELGETRTYLGMEITRNRKRKEIRVAQRKYISELEQKFNLNPEDSAPTPLAQNLKLQKAQPEEVTAIEDTPAVRYPELIGCLMYLMVCTRPDISHTLAVLSSFLAVGRHGAKHWQAAIRVLRYIKGTKDLDLCLGSGGDCLQGYSDSSWADSQENRKSSQGYIFFMGSSPISWKATKSSSVALSTCEAELYACTSAAQECMWLKHLLKELDSPQNTVSIWCDNTSTISLTKDPVFSGRSKHIEARYFFIRELAQEKELNVKHVSGEKNPADIFTKPLSIQEHWRYVTELGLAT